MATRTHVSAALVLLISFFTTGCIFGGGGKKQRAPQAGGATPAPYVDADGTLQTPGVDVSQARADARVRDLVPRESQVQWPDPGEFRLHGETPAPQKGLARETAQPQPEAAPDQIVPDRIAPDAIARDAATTIDSPPARERVEIRDATLPVPASASAVANGGLEVSEPPPEAQTASASLPKIHPLATVVDASASPGAGELAGRIGRRMSENRGDLSAHLDHQLLRFLSDESVPDLGVLSTLPPDDRELLTTLIDGLVNFRNGVRADGNMLLSRKVRPLLDMAGRLRSQADLSIRTIALCRSVRGFGVYEPIEARFVAGTAKEAIIYCQVENVSSRFNEQQVWESQLAQEAVLYTESGQRVWSNQRQTTPDLSRNRRQDFCALQRVMFPPTLTIGRYILKVTVIDEQVNRVAEATMPIEFIAGGVGAPPSQAPVAVPAGPNLAERSTAEARTAGERQPAPVQGK